MGRYKIVILRAPQRVKTDEEAKQIVDGAIGSHAGITTEAWSKVPDLRVTVVLAPEAKLVWKHKIAPSLLRDGWKNLSAEIGAESPQIWGYYLGCCAAVGLAIVACVVFIEAFRLYQLYL